MTIDDNKVQEPVDDIAFDGTAADQGLGKSEADVGHTEAPAESTAAADGTEFAEPSKDHTGKPSADKTLYIGNLFFEVTPDALRQTFEQIGEVITTKVVTDARGLSRGFGFVEFVKAEDASRAVEQLDQNILQGRRMLVQVHKPRTSRQVTVSKNNPTTTVFIGNMSYEMSDRDLSDLFRDMRNVLDVRVAIDRNTGQNRGFAHADFADVESAQEAYDKLNGKTVHGRLLRVDFSNPSAMSRQSGT